MQNTCNHKVPEHGDCNRFNTHNTLRGEVHMSPQDTEHATARSPSKPPSKPQKKLVLLVVNILWLHPAWHTSATKTVKEKLHVALNGLLHICVCVYM